MAKLKQCYGNGDDTANVLEFYCQGCKAFHAVAVGENKVGLPVWEWNHDLDNPTLSSSVLVRSWNKGVEHKCHSFIKNGKIQYLTDSSHDLAGKTTDMIEIDSNSWLMFHNK